MTHRSEHLAAETVENYRAQRLSPAELLAAQWHAAACAGCRERLGEAVGVESAFESVRAAFAPAAGGETEHIAYEQLAAYVDGQLDEVEREIAESHLAICGECEADARDLRGYQVIPARTPERIAERTPAREAGPAPAGGEPFWRRLFNFKQFPAYAALVPAAAVAALVAVILLGVWTATRPVRPSGGNSQALSGGGQQAGDAPANPAQASAPALPQMTAEGPSPRAQLPPDEVASDAPPGGVESRAPSPRRGAAGEARPSPALSVALNDGGGRVSYDGAGNLRGLESLPPEVRRAVQASLSAQRVEVPRSLDGLRGSAGVLMGDAAGGNEGGGVPFALVEPVGKVVRTTRPTFRWRPLGGASSYTVAVVDAKFNVVEQGSGLTATEWTPSQPLPRGAVYGWQVTALRDGKEVASPVAPAPQAKFRVLEQTVAENLARVEAGHADSHLARGVLYARAGLLDEARQEFQSLLKANPRSAVARKLLESVSRR